MSYERKKYCDDNQNHLAWDLAEADEFGYLARIKQLEMGNKN